MNKSSSSVSGKSKFKIVFLGDTNTGKTSIIERFINDKFNPESTPTIGIDFLGRNINYKQKYYRLQLWDTAGQERYKSLIPSYLKDAICAVYVFDQSSTIRMNVDLESLDNLERWIQMFKENKGTHTVSAICGNKLDLCREFDRSKLDTIMLRNKMPFYQVSACTGEGIEEMFFGIIEQINEMNRSRTKQHQLLQQQVSTMHTQQHTATSNIDFDVPAPTDLQLKHNHQEEEVSKPLIKKKRCCG